MVPIFRTHASLGKSILTSDFPDPKRGKDRSDSIFDIAVDHSLKELWVVEENCSSVFEISRNCQKLGIEFRFGLLFKIGSIKEEVNVNGKVVEKERSYKQILFAKNADGIKQLFSIFTMIETVFNGLLPEEEFSKLNFENLYIVVPFYDSYIDKNLRHFGTFVPNFPVEPYYFIENNGLPFDKLIENRVRKISNNVIKTKTILYRRKSDFEAWQVYKMACNDKIGGKRPNIHRPEMEHCGSDLFCYEID